MRATFLPFVALVALAGILAAQSSKTVVVPAATPVVKSQAPAAPAADSPALKAALKMLEEMKAVNEDTLKKQAATLEQLDLIEQAADQLKIYSKRG